MITYVTEDGMYWEIDSEDLITVYQSNDGQYKVDHYVYYASCFDEVELVTVNEIYLVVNDENKLIGSFRHCEDAMSCILSKRLCDAL
jgi:hypothetical protein